MFKKVLTAILLLCSTFANAQWNYPITAQWVSKFKVDKIFWLNTSDTTGYSAALYPGALVYQQMVGDTSIYFSTGLKYEKVGKYLDTTSLSTRINAKVDSIRWKDSLAVQTLETVTSKGNTTPYDIYMDYPSQGRFRWNVSNNALNRIYSMESGGGAFRPMWIGSGGLVISDIAGSLVGHNGVDALQVQGTGKFNGTVQVAAATADEHAVRLGQLKDSLNKKVSSVSITMPSIFYITNPTPPNGNITVDWAGSQTPNLILASPNGGFGPVSLRAMVEDDIPDLSSVYIPLTQKGAANGVPTLGADSKIPAIYLPTSGSNYIGTWNASTNTPTLIDGTGASGDYYIVNVAGTQNLGSGSIVFDVGDNVVYNGTTWQKVPTANSVVSVNGMIGVVVIDKTDVGLSNVDNTSDLAKPISTATQTALNGKEATITAGTLAQYWRGDKTWQDFTTSARASVSAGPSLTYSAGVFAANFGTASGTVAQGNDSRILNGQTAFGWGDHAGLYPLLAGSYANPSWITALAWSKITGVPSTFPTSSTLQDVTTNGNETNRFLHITGGNDIPVSGSGLELFYDPMSSSSIVQSYDRSASTYRGLGLYGSPITLYSSGTKTIELTGGRALFGGAVDDFSSALQVNGDVRTSSYFNANGGAFMTGDASFGYIGSYGTRPLQLVTNGLERMRIDANGLVGINTDAPTTTLDVNGIVTAQEYQSPSGNNLILDAGDEMEFQLTNNTMMTLAGGQLGVGMQPSGSMFGGAQPLVQAAGNIGCTDAFILDAGGVLSEFGLGTNLSFLRTITNHPLQFKTNDTERMRIGADGKITVNGATASAEFNVAGDIIATGSVNGNLVNATTSATTGALYTGTRVITANTAFSVAATDHTILTRSFSTGTGTSITLPDPAAHAGRILTFIENTASSWTTNYSIITTTGSPLTVISGTMTIQAIDGDWWLVSKM